MRHHLPDAGDACTPFLRQRSGSEEISDFPTPRGSEGTTLVRGFLPLLTAAAPGGAKGGLGGLLGELPAILVTAVTTGIYGVTYGGLCYRAAGLAGSVPPDGVATWLLGSLLGQVPISVFSGIPFGISSCAVEMLPILHAIFQSIASSMPGEDPRDVLATCLATTFSATLSLGIVLYVGGRTGCARWLRTVPVVVLKGALFGVAIFLLESAYASSAATPPESLEAAWPQVGLVVTLGTLIFVLDEAVRSPTAIVLALLAVGAAPQALVLLGLTSWEELTAGGWLIPLPAAAGQDAWYRQMASVYLESLPRVSWSVVVSQVPAVLGLWLTHLLCALTDLKAVEIITQTDVELDTELRAMGLGNMLSALGGGWPVYLLCSQNVTARKLGGCTHAVGLGKLVLVFPMLFVAQTVVPYLPCALPGSVAWWLGMSFIKETGVDVFFQHSHGLDVGIVAAMAVVITWAGLLQGLLVGFLLAVWAFVLQYSGLSPVVRASDNATFLHSNVCRPLVQYQVLERLGHRIHVVHLEGYIMFGSSPQLLDTVRPLLVPGGPRWVVLSLRGVKGLDYSAICDLGALGRQAAACSCCLVLTELRGAVRDSIARARLRLPEPATEEGKRLPPGICYMPHYHPALKLCEDALLASATGPDLSAIAFKLQDHAEPELAMVSQTFGDYLDNDEGALRELLKRFERMEYAPGATLYQAGEPAEFCFGVVSGQLHAMQPMKSKGGDLTMMEVVTPGAFIGFSGVLNQLPYVQTVVVPSDGEPCSGLALRWGNFAALSEEQPRLATALLRAFLRRTAYEFRALSRLAAQA